MRTLRTNAVCRCLTCNYCSRERLDAVDLVLIDSVREDGWAVVVISDGEPAAWSWS